MNKTANQYGEPMKDFLLAKVAVIWADTPKSAKHRHTVPFYTPIESFLTLFDDNYHQK